MQVDLVLITARAIANCNAAMKHNKAHWQVLKHMCTRKINLELGHLKHGRFNGDPWVMAWTHGYTSIAKTIVK